MSAISRTRNGFTLVELLVVITIMAIMAVSVTLPIMNRGKSPRDAAVGIAAFVAQVRDESLFNGRNLALEISPWQMRAVELDRVENPAGAWMALPDNDAVGDMQTWADLRVSLSVEGHPVLPQPLGDKPKPQIFMTSGGETTPFSLVLFSDNGSHAGFSLDGFGAVTPAN